MLCFDHQVKVRIEAVFPERNFVLEVKHDYIVISKFWDIRVDAGFLWAKAASS
jgi:hypothetical protein